MERPFFFARVVLAVWIMALCSACAWAEDIVDIALPNMRNPERQNARILAYRIKALETWQNADNAKSARKVNPDELKQMRGILKERPVEASRVGAVQDVLGQTLADPGNAGWKEDLDALKERMKAYAKEKGLEFAEDGYRKLQEFVRNRRAGLSKDIDAMRLGREVSGYIENILRYEDAPGDASIYSYEKFRQNSDPELTPRELAVIGHQIRRKLPLKIRGEEFKSLDYLHLLGLLAEHDRTVNLMVTVHGPTTPMKRSLRNLRSARQAFIGEEAASMCFEVCFPLW